MCIRSILAGLHSLDSADLTVAYISCLFWWQDCERAMQLAPRAHKPAHRRIQALKGLGLLEVGLMVYSSCAVCAGVWSCAPVVSVLTQKTTLLHFPA